MDIDDCTSQKRKAKTLKDKGIYNKNKIFIVNEKDEDSNMLRISERRIGFSKTQNNINELLIAEEVNLTVKFIGLS
jgi:hypothetical protein